MAQIFLDTAVCKEKNTLISPISPLEGLEFSPSYVPDVTSYDYDAPLTECGQYTAKYNATREMIAAYDPLYDTLR